MRLPNAEKAHIEHEKLEGYCLSPAHPHGKHKALLFEQLLGLGSADSFWLKSLILDVVKTAPAEFKETTRHGELWQVDFEVERNNRSVVIRTGWIVRFDEDFPRLTTCFIL